MIEISIFAFCFEFERIKYATAVLIALFLFPVQTLILGFRRDDFLVLRMLMCESLKLYY